ncbi:Stromal cell-derived factor 2-like protein 1 [Dinochytrium kinnereticum]|nr:Stromal cell-derived factor 2-like protein 1 [Dinochytrium kinnereticum]
MKAILTGLLLLIPLTLADFVIEPEFEKVTCGSSVKLVHSSTGYRLHSHGINYGSGSGQQSVTGFPSGDDAKYESTIVCSYFVVFAPVGHVCKRGVPVKCGDAVRLLHMNTHKFLHSHGHSSPLSSNQEVSAYEYSDVALNNHTKGDNWKVICQNKKDKFWLREQKIRLQHVETGKFLSSNIKYQFRNPIPGQLEISAVSGQGANEIWHVQGM